MPSQSLRNIWILGPMDALQGAAEKDAAGGEERSLDLIVEKRKMVKTAENPTTTQKKNHHKKY